MLRSILAAAALLHSFLGTMAQAEQREGQAGVAMLRQGTAIADFPGSYYGTVELRHHLNTYYTPEDDLGRQTPSFQGRVKVGATFRDNFIDAFATFGLIKGAQTQQMLQRRPEFEIDLYPWLSEYGQLVQYNLIQMPFAESELERQESDIAAPRTDGSIYTVGLAPTLVLPMLAGGHLFKIKAGADGWTQFFSRAQYRDDSRSPDERDHYAISEQEGEDESRAPAEREDIAQRYYTQYMLGGSFTPGFAPHVTLALGAYHDLRFLPQYTESEEENDFHYIRQDTSHYRGRLEIELSDRASLINDFYHFFDGFFAAKRDGDHRRFRNIARISYKI